MYPLCHEVGILVVRGGLRAAIWDLRLWRKTHANPFRRANYTVFGRIDKARIPVQIPMVFIFLDEIHVGR
jgi:hypothetical protein